MPNPPQQFLEVPLQAGDVVLREAKNGIILVRVGLDSEGNLTTTETIFEDRQPVLKRRIEVEASPRVMPMAEALRAIARDLLGTPTRFGLFIGLQSPGKKHICPHRQSGCTLPHPLD